MNRVAIDARINGRRYDLLVDPNRTLLDVLREEIGLSGTKRGCEIGECGACTVLMNGKAVNSCLVLIPQIAGQDILTVEGLAEGHVLHPLQEAFLDHEAVQCGFCTPGMLMSAKALLHERASPDEKEIRTAIAGNLCRCTGYVQIVDAINDAAKKTHHR